MTIHLTIKTLITLVLVACAGWFAIGPYFYGAAITSPFFSLALVSVTIIHFRVRSRWMDALLILACTASMAVVDFLILNYPLKIVAWFSFLGVSSLLVMAVRAVWSLGEDRKLLVMAFVPAFLFVASEYLASDLLGWTERAHRKTLDLYLFSFDSSLRAHLSFLMGQAFEKWLWLRIPGKIFYLGLPVPIALIFAGQLVRIRERSLPAMAAFLIAGPLGVVFYNLFPALGPIHIFRGEFPWHALPIRDVPRLFLEAIAVPGPRNAMPSLHLAWALLAWWYSAGLSWYERTVAMLFLVFTALATLGTGEHYFVDLVVAYPFALMIVGMCAYPLSWKDAQRFQPFFFGLLVALAWLTALRYLNRLFWLSPLIPWMLCAATVAATIFFKDRLWRAVEVRARIRNSQTGRVPVFVA